MTMNNLIKRLPAFAFALAAITALSLNVPVIGGEKTATKVWTPDSSQPNGYRDITGEAVGTHYRCNGDDQECRVEFSNDDPMSGVKNVLDEGIYTPL